MMKIQEKTYIPKNDLIDGALYECKARNFSIGRWNKELDGFEYIREKFGHRHESREFHWDNGPPFGTVKPYKLVEEDL